MNNNRQQPSVFQPAGKTERYLKVLLHGAPGTGKTLAALSFPRPLAVIDLEGGTGLYSGDFSVLRTKDLAKIEQAVEELARGGFKTIVIDPLTVYWQLLQDGGQGIVDRRMQQDSLESGKALTPREWGLVKRKNNSVLTRLINLSLHVVLIARDTDQYEGTGDNLRKVGVKADVEKGTPYLADFVFTMQAETVPGKPDRFFAVVEKSRSLLLPKGMRLDGYTTDPAHGLFQQHLAKIAAAQTQGGALVQIEEDAAVSAGNANVLEQAEQPKQSDGERRAALGKSINAHLRRLGLPNEDRLHLVRAANGGLTNDQLNLEQLGKFDALLGRFADTDAAYTFLSGPDAWIDADQPVAATA